MIVGIDLGTTNSLVGVWKDGGPVLVPNALGHFMTPSIVAVDASGDYLVGLPAREIMLRTPEKAAATFKRYMGTNKLITVGKKEFRPEELSAFVLRSLKRDTEAFLGESVTEAIITVPAYFNELQRKATKVAGQLAGLNVDRLLNEPTAAALAYGLNIAAPESKILVFDLGGGTFDVSILESFEGIMEVRACAGNNRLGGEDFVDILVSAFYDEIYRTSGIPKDQIDVKTKLAIRQTAELAKRELSTSESAQMKLSWDNRDYNLTITEKQFETLVEPLLKQLRSPVDRAIRDARLKPSDLSEIVLVGGATRKPVVRRLVAKMFGRIPSGQINPDEAVAMGAAVQAGLKSMDRALKDVVMTDICPYTLGIEVSVPGVAGTQRGFFHPLIERNTTVPVSRIETFAALDEMQQEVIVGVYQGESPLVKDNIFLNKLHVPLPMKPGQKQDVKVRFTYDINGLLEVEATVESSGLTKSLVIEENPGTMSASEIRSRLDALTKLKIHPRELTENRNTIARAERAFEETTGDTRKVINDHLAYFLAVVEKQDPAEIAIARGKIDSLIDQVLGKPYL